MTREAEAQFAEANKNYHRRLVSPFQPLFRASQHNLTCDSLRSSQFIEMVEGCYETGLIEWSNGSQKNPPGTNEGSAHVLSLAALADLPKEKALLLWAEHYRDVLATPDGDDHQNIRQFMEKGWDGVDFSNGIR